MHLSGVRQSVRPSVCLFVSPIRPPHAAAADLLLWVRRYRSIAARPAAGGQQQLRRSTAHSSKCGQRHVVSGRKT